MYTVCQTIGDVSVVTSGAHREWERKEEREGVGVPCSSHRALFLTEGAGSGEIGIGGPKETKS